MSGAVTRVPAARRVPPLAARAVGARMPGAQDGFMLIETIMSALLVALIAVGVYAGIDGPAATSAANQQRSVAATLAEQDQESLRAMPVTSLSNYQNQYTKQACSDGSNPPCNNGRTIAYTINSSAQWATSSTGALACGSTTADYLKLTSQVTWQSEGIVKPVTLESIYAPPPASFNSTTGNLSVQLQDQDSTPNPAVGVPVTVNSTGSPTINTNSQGCSFFGYLPVGTYNVTYSQPGYVDPSGNNAISSTQSVSQGNTTVLQGSYAPAGQIAVSFQTLLQGQSQPTAVQAPYVSVANTGIPAQTRTFGTGTAASTITAGSLFPFPSGYGIYAGQCAGDNPVNNNSNYYTQNPAAMVTVGPGGGYSATVYMPTINVAVQNVLGASLGSARVTVKQTAASCSGLDSWPTVQANSQGVFANPYPFGAYTVTAECNGLSNSTTVYNYWNGGSSPNSSGPSSTTTIRVTTPLTSCTS